MARKPRIDFPGAWHHVMHRGARRAPIFGNDDDVLLFLETVGKVVWRFGLEVHAYALMPNHYHLLVRTPHGNLSSAMRHLNAVYTQAANRARRFDGPLFRGRFHSQALRTEQELPFVLAYIHLNPLRANLVTRLTSDSWTSHRAYTNRESAPSWLSRDFFLGLFGSGDALHDYALDLHRDRRSWPEQMALETGWLADLEQQGETQSRTDRTTRTLRGPEALELVCRVTGASCEELYYAPHGPRANPARRFAVWALAHGTVLTQREIGEALQMTTVQVANVLRRQRTSAEPFLAWREMWSRAVSDK